MEPLQALAASMAADASRLHTLGQNLVNAGVPAYKRELLYVQPQAQGFSAALSQAMVAPATATDMRAGTLRATGQPLDIALATPNSFLEVQTPQGAALTRRGDLRLDELARLCTHDGHPVMGEAGPLTLPPGAVDIAQDGSVSVAGQAVGRLRLVQLKNPAELQRLGGSLYRQGEAALAEAGTASVRQRHLEVSNVDSAAEMVNLLQTLRHFEAAQKLVQGMDDMQERALRKLGEF